MHPRFGGVIEKDVSSVVLGVLLNWVLSLKRDDVPVLMHVALSSGCDSYPIMILIFSHISWFRLGRSAMSSGSSDPVSGRAVLP